MKIAVLGATGNVGREIVGQAREASHEVRAYARASSAASLPKHDRSTVQVGELDDDVALAQRVRGTDPVLSVLGPRRNTTDEVARFGDALSRVTRIMRDAKIDPLVSISGAATFLEGERPPSVERSGAGS